MLARKNHNMDVDIQRPSIFDLLACDNLKSGLREAFRYLLEKLNNDSETKRFVVLNADELVLLIDTLIEYSYLRAYNASYAENLFGLIRFTAQPGSSGHRGKLKSILPSLLSLTVVPYVTNKIDKYFQELNRKETRTPNELKQLKYHKLMNRLRALVNLAYVIRHSSGRSAYHSAMNALLSVQLRALTLDDLQIRDKHKQTSVDEVCKKTADSLGRILTVGSYMIQFLDFWNTRTNSSPLFGSNRPTPKAPKLENYAHSDERSSSMCLICLNVRQNECALSNTGYVFCYKCIHRYVTTNSRCPITGHPANVNNIVQLFTPSAPS